MKIAYIDPGIEGYHNVMAKEVVEYYRALLVRSIPPSTALNLASRYLQITMTSHLFTPSASQLEKRPNQEQELTEPRDEVVLNSQLEFYRNWLASLNESFLRALKEADAPDEICDRLVVTQQDVILYNHLMKGAMSGT